jgi:flagellar basal-body rod protein FlgF
METPIFIALSRQVALRDQMDIIANNVANMSTPGYRAQNMVFKEYLAKPKGQEKLEEKNYSMVEEYGQYQSTEAGPMQRTENPLDVAAQGPGYFGIQTPDGIMYTRDGSFQMNGKGELIDGAGQTVASAGGGSITIPAGAKQISIAHDGTISTDKGQAGQLMVMEFNDEQTLAPQGNGLYKAAASDPGTAATHTTVVEGMLEGSNVKPVLEMTRMIDVLRNYQSTQQILQSEHDRQRSMIERLSHST